MNPLTRHKFYWSREWREKRIDILKRDNNECQKCKARGRVGSGDCVHHIKHLETNPYLALTNSNLVTLCNSCHNEEHPEKFKKINKKKKPRIPERW